AVADRGGHRKRMLAAFSLLGIIATLVLYFVAQGQWLAAAVLFMLGTLGFNGGVVFCDALLLDVAKPADYDRVSSQGYALGYLGGGLLFAINVLMVSKPAWFGLASAADAVRWSFVSVALWWFVFMQPLLWFVKESTPTGQRGWRESFTAGWSELVATAGKVWRQPLLLQFLVAYWLYIDGVNTVVKMAVDYGLAAGIASTHLLGALLLTQFVAFPASLGFGWLGGKIGARAAVLVGLAAYSLLTAWAYFLDTPLEFYLMAAVLGLVQGGVQSLSRSMYGRLVPEGKSAEYFGFYNMVGKFGTVLGPALMGVVALVTGSTRVSILALLMLFVGGGVLLWRVRVR
ncbi:MAG TPA: MFS transporter, partial [Steroidobacteraceae bacterium]|nr:MFS transporter [Steroidobacteraceae bacterium]